MMILSPSLSLSIYIYTHICMQTQIICDSCAKSWQTDFLGEPLLQTLCFVTPSERTRLPHCSAEPAWLGKLQTCSISGAWARDSKGGRIELWLSFSAIQNSGDFKDSNVFACLQFDICIRYAIYIYVIVYIYIHMCIYIYT